MLQVCCFCFDIKQSASIIAWVLLATAIGELTYNIIRMVYITDDIAREILLRKWKTSLSVDEKNVSTTTRPQPITHHPNHDVGGMAFRIYHAVGIVKNFIEISFYLFLMAAIGMERKILLRRWLLSYAVFFSLEWTGQFSWNIALTLVTHMRTIYVNWAIVSLRLVLYGYFYYVLWNFYHLFEEDLQRNQSSNSLFREIAACLP